MKIKCEPESMDRVCVQFWDVSVRGVSHKGCIWFDAVWHGRERCELVPAQRDKVQAYLAVGFEKATELAIITLEPLVRLEAERWSVLNRQAFIDSHRVMLYTAVEDALTALERAQHELSIAKAALESFDS